MIWQHCWVPQVRQPSPVPPPAARQRLRLSWPSNSVWPGAGSMSRPSSKRISRSGSVQKLAIDASTAAKWQLSEEPEAERARHMLRDYAAEKVAFVTPTIWHYEVANIVNKAV